MKKMRSLVLVGLMVSVNVFGDAYANLTKEEVRYAQHFISHHNILDGLDTSTPTTSLFTLSQLADSTVFEATLKAKAQSDQNFGAKKAVKDFLEIFNLIEKINQNPTSEKRKKALATYNPQSKTLKGLVQLLRTGNKILVDNAKWFTGQERGDITTALTNTFTEFTQYPNETYELFALLMPYLRLDSNLDNKIGFEFNKKFIALDRARSFFLNEDILTTAQSRNQFKEAFLQKLAPTLTTFSPHDFVISICLLDSFKLKTNESKQFELNTQGEPIKLWSSYISAIPGEHSTANRPGKKLLDILVSDANVFSTNPTAREKLTAYKFKHLLAAPTDWALQHIPFALLKENVRQTLLEEENSALNIITRIQTQVTEVNRQQDAWDKLMVWALTLKTNTTLDRATIGELNPNQEPKPQEFISWDEAKGMDSEALKTKLEDFFPPQTV